MTSWFKAKLGGRFRVSTLVLIVAFIALFWVQQSFQPEQPQQEPVPAVVPPGFVPDPNYTWVPRTQVRRPKEADTTTTTTPTTTTETTTPSPTESESPTSPSPTTTVVDPDGPLGPLGPQTLTQTPTVTTPTTPTTAAPVPGTVPASPEAPR
jgi:hypothetical protein